MTTTTPAETTSTPSFEFYEGNLSESSATPRITIRRGGLMVVSRAAAEMLGDDVSHIQFAYDRLNGAIGIRAATAETAGSYRLRTQRKSPTRLVGARRFLKYHEIKTEKATTFEVRDFGNGIIGFRIEGEPTAAKTDGAEKGSSSKKPTRRKTKAA